MKTRFPKRPNADMSPVRVGARGRAVARHGCRWAFSLVEVLVAVAVMSLIVIGLLMMFNQTQRAFRGSITQTDVLESGRAVTELIARELEQASPSYLGAVNFLVDVSGAAPLLQALPAEAVVRRTNLLQSVFFLTCVNQQWTAIGYRVECQPPNSGVGTLYRFSTNIPAASIPNFHTNFLYGRITNFNRVVDGVIHFRLRAFTNGHWVRGDGYVRPTILVVPYPPGGEYSYAFASNALPSTVELELGIVEPPVLERFRALTNNVLAARAFLSDRAGAVHLFRQRIPIRNADPQAYQ